MTSLAQLPESKDQAVEQIKELRISKYKETVGAVQFNLYRNYLELLRMIKTKKVQWTPKGSL